MTFVVTKIINENSEALKQSKAANISQFSKIKLPCSGFYRGASKSHMWIFRYKYIYLISRPMWLGVMVNG